MQSQRKQPMRRLTTRVSAAAFLFALTPNCLIAQSGGDSVALVPPVFVPPITVEAEPSLESPAGVASRVYKPVDRSDTNFDATNIDGPPSYESLAAEVTLLERLSKVVRGVSTLVRPSVVHIEASKTEKTLGRSESYEEAGSGVIIARGNQTWVVTNRHVIVGSQPEAIVLKLSDGRKLIPTKVLSDSLTDVAILEVKDRSLTPARIGNSTQMEIGDFVIAVGSPFGLNHSVTFGIVSARGRRDLTLGDERIELQDFIQTDAAINPGNSGGPLVNLRGEVIGLNTAIASSSGGGVGIGFAIPIEMVVHVADQLIRYGEVQRGYLGVSLDPSFDSSAAIRMNLPVNRGALVKTVRDGSPAKKAGIAVGDVIVKFDDVDIENDDHLVTCVGLTDAGHEAEVILYRSGKSYRTTVQIGSGS